MGDNQALKPTLQEPTGTGNPPTAGPGYGVKAIERRETLVYLD